MSESECVIAVCAWLSKIRTVRRAEDMCVNEWTFAGKPNACSNEIDLNEWTSRGGGGEVRDG